MSAYMLSPLYSHPIARLLFTFLVWLWSLLSTSFAADPNDVSHQESARQLFENIYIDRLAITRLEIEWTVDVITDKAYSVLEGCRYSLHAWFDYAGERMRVDSQESCPNDSRLTRNRRFAFSGNRFLVVNSENLVGHEKERLNASYIHDPHSGTVFSLSADMRLIGILPERYMTLKNYSQQEILRPIADSRSVTVTEEVLYGAALYKVGFVGFHGVDCELTYWLDKHHGLPLRILCEAATETGVLQTELQTAWQSYASGGGVGTEVMLPSRTITRRWEDGELTNEERLTILDAKVNNRPDDIVFTWAGMNLPDNFVVRHTAGKSQQMKRWSAELGAFGPWNPRPLLRNIEDVANPSRSPRLLLLVVNVAVIMLMVALLKRRQMRQHG
jgi:hypothetical protein